MNKPGAWVASAVIVGGLAYLLCPYAANALHRVTPLVVQVTDAPSQTIGGPKFSVGQNVTVFHADGDLLGNGNTVPQIFLFEQSARVTGKKGSALYQLTFADQASLHPAAASRAKVLTFHSTADHLNNGSLGRQIFASRRVRWKKRIEVPLLQVTRGSGESFDPVVSQTGRYLAFSSTGDLTSEGVGPGQHLYRVELRRLEKVKDFCKGYPCISNPGIKLVTPVEAFAPSIDGPGERIVFQSRADAAGLGCANGAMQLFLRNLTSNTTEQLTFGPGDSRNASFTLDGSAIYFESSSDLALTGNSLPNIFRMDLSVLPHRITQITFGADGDSTEATPSGVTGRLVFFKSTANLNGAAAGVQRLYVAETNYTPAKLTRLTDGQPILSGLTAQFTFVEFASDGDFLGNGNALPQLFLINVFPLLDPIPQPTASATPTPAGTPTATPVPGVPTNIGLALLTNDSADNGDNTLTTVIAATVADYLGNPVPNGLPVNFSVSPANEGVVVSNGTINADPDCDVSRFEQKTGLTIINQPGVAHVCLTYPGALAGTKQGIIATSGPASAFAAITLPLAHNDCLVNGQPCSDFNPCTVGDVCGGGTTERACIAGVNIGLPCTSQLQCPDVFTCQGGNDAGKLCTTGTDCSGGVCALAGCQLVNPPTCQPGAAMVCADDGNLCTTDVCNFLTGTCGVPVRCPYDGNPCTDDFCSLTTGLCYTPNSEPCVDTNPCTDNICDGTTGTCGIPNTLPCEDGDLCTVGDICSAGLCVPGTVPVCPNDGNPCTNDVCNPVDGTCGVPQACVCP